jgi:membrane-associated phospholipid phosphatase
MKFIKTIDEAENWLIDIDHRTHKFFKPFADTPAVGAVDLFSKLGDQPELRIISGLLLAAGVFARSDRLIRAGARMIIAHETATFAKDRLKTEIDRTRPRSAKGKRDKKVKPGNHTAKEKTSFPSGHSAGAVAAAMAFGREFPEHRVVAIGAAGAVAFSQIPRCAHYPTDVVAGATIGLVAEALVNAAWNAADMDGRSET